MAVASGPQTLEQITKLINECFHTRYGFREGWSSFQEPHPIQVTTKDVMGIMREHTDIFSLEEEKDGTLTVVGIDHEIRESIATGPYQSAYWVAKRNCFQI
jgi:hypothetical protein